MEEGPVAGECGLEFKVYTLAPWPAIPSPRFFLFLFGAFEQLHVETEGLKLLDQNVERFRETRLEGVLPFDDCLVHPGPARHVVRLDGEEFLQRVSSAVGFHGPDLHLPESLSTELRLAAQRLLGNKRVG